MQLSVTPWIAAHKLSLSFTISQSLLRHLSIELVMSSNHLILCHPLLLLPSIFPSIRVFSNRCPKRWSISCSISPSNEYLGLISFNIDQFDLLAVQGTLKSLLLHHNLKASILLHSAFFMVQLSYPCMTTRKTIALTRCIFISNASTFSYTVQVCHSFSSKEQVSLNFMAAVTIRSDFGAQEKKICHCCYFSPFYLP